MTLSPASLDFIRSQLLALMEALQSTSDWELKGLDHLDRAMLSASNAVHLIRSEIAYNCAMLRPPSPPSSASIDDL